MKVIFKNMINGYTGNADDYVMYFNRRINKVIMREKPVYHNHPAHPGFKAVMANFKALNPSPAYREDCIRYIQAYNELVGNSKPHIVTWSNLFQKIMWMMKRIMPEVNLATLTKEQIYTLDLPCVTIKKAVETGILLKVKGYTGLNHQI